MKQQFKVTGTKDTYIIFDKVLGKGAYGVVFYAESVKQKDQLAAKIISKSSLSSTDIANLRNEIKNQQSLTHPNIVQMVDAFEDSKYLYMILEYCSGGCLHQNIILNGPLREQRALKYFIQVVNAIHYIHGKGILHRDVKLSNLLLARDGQVKLADFTWCIKMRNGCSPPQICGTLEYMPPEVHRNGIQNKKLDIWSLGITLYEMLHGDRPSNGVLTLKPGLSDECKRLMRSMLEVETFKRPSTADILESFWVKSYNSGLTISISPKIKTETATQIIKNLESQFGSPLRTNSTLRTASGTSSGSPNDLSPFGSPQTKSNEKQRQSKNATTENFDVSQEIKQQY